MHARQDMYYHRSSTNQVWTHNQQQATFQASVQQLRTSTYNRDYVRPSQRTMTYNEQGHARGLAGDAPDWTATHRTPLMAFDAEHRFVQMLNASERMYLQVCSSSIFM